MAESRPALVLTVRPKVNELEILRISAGLRGDYHTLAAEAARKQILLWTKSRTTGALPSYAWAYQSFDHFAGGRNCSAVRLVSTDSDIWALRAEDPDKETPIVQTLPEASVILERPNTARFTLRLLAASPETELPIEPHVPGLVLQLINSPGLVSGNYRLTEKVARSDCSYRGHLN